MTEVFFILGCPTALHFICDCSCNIRARMKSSNSSNKKDKDFTYIISETLTYRNNKTSKVIGVEEDEHDFGV